MDPEREQEIRDELEYLEEWDRLWGERVRDLLAALDEARERNVTNTAYFPQLRELDEARAEIGRLQERINSLELESLDDCAALKAENERLRRIEAAVVKEHPKKNWPGTTCRTCIALRELEEEA